MPPDPVSTQTQATSLQNQTQLSQGSSNAQGAQQNQGAGTTATNNTYLPWQSNLQQQAGGAVGDFLNTGALPQGFQQAQDQQAQTFNSNFQRFVAPGMAAQYGAGSPAIGAQQTLGLANLQANEYNTQLGAYQGAINSGAQIGFNPTGNTSNQAQQTTSTSNNSGNWQESMDDLIALANSATSIVTGLP